MATPAVGDSVRSGEWPLDAQHFAADKVWATSRGTGVIVAVVDSGVSATHPDLSDQVLAGTSLLGDGGDGRTDTSSDSHGTAIAGIIAGTGGTAGSGMTGLAPQAKILPVKVSTGAQVAPSAVAQGIVWAADHGAQVINVSMGTATPDPLLKQAVTYAMRKNAVLVASAGNQGSEGNPAMYPAAFPGVVSVSGINSDGSFWTASESGNGVTLAAPASDIYSTNDLDEYVHAEGTSYSAAYVSATAALIRSRWPDLTEGQVVQRLIATTRNHRNQPDAQLGYGALDPLAAITADVRTTGADNPLLNRVGSQTAHGATSSPDPLWAAAGVCAVLLGGSASIFALRRRRRQAGRTGEASSVVAAGSAAPPKGRTKDSGTRVPAPAKSASTQPKSGQPRPARRTNAKGRKPS
ncbi:type VII secretion-associated serine protease mycosin [Kitasatospora cinereorecta]|uniref:Type VII secretion-associated serine protease mycosin n=1 Tax=Kitasatospora cinereorecta TaxID=285560 RepID=A0ABW0VM61_9ACTN